MSFLILIQLISSCKNTIEDDTWINKSTPGVDSQILHHYGEVSLMLDSTSILTNETFQYVEAEQKVVSFNSFDNTFQVYNYPEMTLSKKISIDSTLKRKSTLMNRRPYSFYYLNKDSILFFDVKNARLILFDSSGKESNRRKIEFNLSKNEFPNTSLGQYLPKINSNTFLLQILPGRNPYIASDSIKSNISLVFNWEVGVSEFTIKYPNLYTKAIWGEYLHKYSAVINKKGDVVVSFPISHNLYVYKSNNSIDTLYAGSRNINAVQPLSFKRKQLSFGRNDEIDNLRSQSIYSTIIYDQYRELYYRIVSAKVPKSELRNSSLSYKYPPFHIIILDRDFKIIGEQEFDSNLHSLTSLFITPEGLFLPSYKSNDNLMIFDIFVSSPYFSATIS